MSNGRVACARARLRHRIARAERGPIAHLTLWASSTASCPRKSIASRRSSSVHCSSAQVEYFSCVGVVNVEGEDLVRWERFSCVGVATIEDRCHRKRPRVPPETSTGATGNVYGCTGNVYGRTGNVCGRHRKRLRAVPETSTGAPETSTGAPETSTGATGNVYGCTGNVYGCHRKRLRVHR